MGGFFFTFSLQSFGFRLEAYPISIPLFFLLFSGLLVLIYGRIRGLPFLFGFMFVFWAFSINLIRNLPPSSYLFSLGALFLLWIPLTLRLPVSNLKIFMNRWFVYGGVFSFIFLYYDLCIIFLNAPPLTELFPFVMDQSTGFNLPRATAAMLEPSYYAAYLVFLYASSDILSKNKIIKPKYNIIIKIHILIGLILTVSLTGVFLIGIYFLTKILMGLLPRINKMLKGRFSVPLPKKSIVLIIMLGIILLFQLPTTAQIFSHIFSRLYAIPQVILQEDYSAGSSGKRLNATNVALLYLKEGNILDISIGEGYANYEDWLESQFSGIYHTTDVAKTLQNVFAIIIISTGLVGFFLYIGFIILIFYSCKNKPGISFPVLWLAYHFATGHLIIYPLFGYLYLVAAEGIALKPVHEK